MGGHCFLFYKNSVTLDNIRLEIKKEGCLIDTTEMERED